MFCRVINNKEEYNNYVSTQKHSQFLQSWEWGEFLKSTGKVVRRFGFWDDNRLFFVVSLYRTALPMGFCYYSAPRIGIKFLNDEKLKFVFSEMGLVVKKEKGLFLRFEPRSEFLITNYELRIKKTIDVQPSKTMVLDLLKTEEELLGLMHQKTRYNIRLAEKKGVVVREAVDVEKDFLLFWDLMKETCGRDGFRLHGKEHYRKMLKASGDDFKIKLFLAEFEGKVIAGNIVSFFGDMATYVHGASSNEYRNVMAPYLLQWHVIKKAKILGYKSYDFYGVDDDKWPGVTRFKRGYNGGEINYPGTFDLILKSFFYRIYYFLRKLRRIF